MIVVPLGVVQKGELEVVDLDPCLRVILNGPVDSQFDMVAIDNLFFLHLSHEEEGEFFVRVQQLYLLNVVGLYPLGYVVDEGGGDLV